MHICVYTYIYIHVYMYTYILKTQHSVPDTQLYIFMSDILHFYDKEKPEKLIVASVYQPHELNSNSCTAF